MYAQLTLTLREWTSTKNNNNTRCNCGLVEGIYVVDLSHVFSNMYVYDTNTRYITRSLKMKTSQPNMEDEGSELYSWLWQSVRPLCS